jgi:hypothetical protein
MKTGVMFNCKKLLITLFLNQTQKLPIEMNILTKFTLALVLGAMLFPLKATAQETEENSRSEFIICALKDGYTMDDVKERASEYAQKLEEDGTQYNQYLMRPLFTGERMEGVTHILAGIWPNGDQMYKEYGAYLNEYMDTVTDNPAECPVTVTTMDWTITDDYRENEKRDQRFPVQIADCKLNDGVSMEYAMSVAKELEEVVRENGMGGYGVHWLSPYLGFEDYEHDFMSLVWWQSFDHRAEMAQNYYKVAEVMEGKMNSVMSCDDPRAYYTENLISTW